MPIHARWRFVLFRNMRECEPENRFLRSDTSYASINRGCFDCKGKANFLIKQKSFCYFLRSKSKKKFFFSFSWSFVSAQDGFRNKKSHRQIDIAFRQASRAAPKVYYDFRNYDSSEHMRWRFCFIQKYAGMWAGKINLTELYIVCEH